MQSEASKAEAEEVRNDGRQDGNTADAQEERQADSSTGRIADALEGLGEVDHAMRTGIETGREVAATVANTVKDSLKTVRETRDSVVMVRLNKDSLQKIDELVDCQVTRSRSEAAALLINEGINARADLFNEVAEQAEIIRQARNRLRTLLGTDAGDDESGTAGA